MGTGYRWSSKCQTCNPSSDIILTGDVEEVVVEVEVEVETEVEVEEVVEVLLTICSILISVATRVF